MLRAIGTRFTQVELHDGGTLSIDYGVAAWEQITQVQAVRGTLGNVGYGPSEQPMVEILEVIAARLVPGGGAAV
jgi:hypothetical protein